MKFLGIAVALLQLGSYFAICYAQAPVGYEVVSSDQQCKNAGSAPAQGGANPVLTLEDCANACTAEPSCTGFSIFDASFVFICTLEKADPLTPTGSTGSQSSCYKKLPPPVVTTTNCIIGYSACGASCCLDALQKCGGSEQNKKCVPKCTLGKVICWNQCCDLRTTYCNPWSRQCRAYHFWG